MLSLLSHPNDPPHSSRIHSGRCSIRYTTLYIYPRHDNELAYDSAVISEKMVSV